MLETVILRPGGLTVQLDETVVRMTSSQQKSRNRRNRVADKPITWFDLNRGLAPNQNNTTSSLMSLWQLRQKTETGPTLLVNLSASIWLSVSVHAVAV